MKDKVEICLKVVSLLFKLLGILGAAFVALVGLYAFIESEFGIFIAKLSIGACSLLIGIVLMMIFDRFSIIKKMIREEL